MGTTVWLASYPRSGNTLVRAALFYGFGIRSASVYREPPRKYPVIGDLALELSAREPDAARNWGGPVFVKTHQLPEQADTRPALYIVRDGRDALVSYARYAMAERQPGFSGAEFDDCAENLIRHGSEGIGDWSGNVRAWTGRSACTALIRFEELVQNPVSTVQRAVESLGFALPEPVGDVPSFGDLRSRDSVLFRKGKVGAWKAELTPRLVELFWELHGPQMLAMGYPHDDRFLAPLVSARNGSLAEIATTQA